MFHVCKSSSASVKYPRILLILWQSTSSSCLLWEKWQIVYEMIQIAVSVCLILFYFYHAYFSIVLGGKKHSMWSWRGVHFNNKPAGNYPLHCIGNRLYCYYLVHLSTLLAVFFSTCRWYKPVVAGKKNVWCIPPLIMTHFTGWYYTAHVESC